LHTCVFRPKFFLHEIAEFQHEWKLRPAGRWDFTGPLNIPEKGRIC